MVITHWLLRIATRWRLSICVANELVAMKKPTFGNQYFFTLAIVFVPVFLIFRYFESRSLMDNLGIWNTMVTALVLSAVPAMIICLWWRYLKK